jgi:predicted ATP-dependent serine protease
MEKRTHWVCPMHDGGMSDKPGRCPKCGMDMVEEEVKDADGSKDAERGDKASEMKMDDKETAKHEGHEHHHE